MKLPRAPRGRTLSILFFGFGCADVLFGLGNAETALLMALVAGILSLQEEPDA